MSRRVPLLRIGELARRVAGTPQWPLAAAAALSVLALIEILVRIEDTGTGPGLLSALLLGLAATGPVALARTHLLVAAGTVSVATLLLLATPLPLPVAALVALAAVLVRVAAVGLGGLRRVRRIAVEREVSRQAVADTLLEHAARGERARIARDLHDVVAHHISMISVQAETARLVTAGLPPDGARALLAIGDTARTALTEMRRLLGVLREGTGGPAREPQPGLAQLVELVDQARDSAGASTRLIVRGGVRPLDPGVELTAYRIVQEALTNARRHAPGAAVDVECHYGGDALRLRVRDNGAEPPDGSTPDGHGLLGMRERAAAVGGELWTGPGPAGGFVVESRLPVPGSGAGAAG